MNLGYLKTADAILVKNLHSECQNFGLCGTCDKSTKILKKHYNDKVGAKYPKMLDVICG